MKNRKYELSHHSITVQGKKLYRIKAVRNFGDVRKDEFGGYIESEANLSHDGNCWVYGEESKVLGNAKIDGNAKIEDGATINGAARVTGNAIIRGEVIIGDNVIIGDYASIYNNAIISGNVVVSGKAIIKDNAEVRENCIIKGLSSINGNACITGETIVDERAIISGEVCTLGKSYIKGSAYVYGDAVIKGGVIQDEAKISSGTYLEGALVGLRTKITNSITVDEDLVNSLKTNIKYQLGILPDNEGFYTLYSYEGEKGWGLLNSFSNKLNRKIKITKVHLDNIVAVEYGIIYIR